MAISNGASKQHWQQARNGLLHLHKTLLDFQRQVYEGQHGKVTSPGAMLSLVMENPNFAWLRQLSEVIVGLDELLESKEVVPEQQYIDTLAYLKKLLVPNVAGNTFEKNYFDAIQKSPSAAIAHSEVQKALQKISA